MKLSEADINEIVQLLRDADFDDLELEWNDIYLRIARRSSLEDIAPPRVAAPPYVPVAAANPPERPKQREQPKQPDGVSTAQDSASAPSGVIEVRSALMGTVYRSPQPGDPPFVEIGASVQPGDTLCLLEVMKVFTALKADTRGIVERILISDGDLVEYNQVIMWIRCA